MKSQRIRIRIDIGQEEFNMTEAVQKEVEITSPNNLGAGLQYLINECVPEIKENYHFKNYVQEFDGNRNVDTQEIKVGV